MSLRSARKRTALSLLEVILAVAILAGCIVMIGELIRLGTRQAEEARELTRGQLLAESKMEEVASGVLPPESISLAPSEYDDRWLYSVSVLPLEDEGLLEVRVTAQEAESIRLQPYTFTLVRWMLDPSLESEEIITDETLEAMPAESNAAGASGTGGGDVPAP